MYVRLCDDLQAEVDFSADGSATPSSPQSAFVTCATSLTEGGQSSTHADDTRALMTVVLLGGISQDDLTVRPYVHDKIPQDEGSYTQQDVC